MHSSSPFYSFAVSDAAVRILASAFPLREKAAGFLVVFSSMEWPFACLFHRLFQLIFIIASCLRSTALHLCVQRSATRGRTQGGSNPFFTLYIYNYIYISI